jgi:hypothetical protein
MKTLHRLGVLCLAGAAAFASPLAQPTDLTIPKTFVSGTPATAADVNQNFSATATSVNSKQDRVTGTCPPGQAVLSINANGSVVCDTNLNNRVTTIETSLLAVTDYRPVGPQTNVMVACRPVGTNTYGLLAQAPRADVIFGTPIDTTTVHVANGTAWYFNTNYSWGFANGADAVSKNSCDLAPANPERRMCWHTGAGNLAGGYRCGVTTGLNGSTAWERVILHRD